MGEFATPHSQFGDGYNGAILSEGHALLLTVARCSRSGETAYLHEDTRDAHTSSSWGYRDVGYGTDCHPYLIVITIVQGVQIPTSV